MADFLVVLNKHRAHVLTIATVLYICAFTIRYVSFMLNGIPMQLGLEAIKLCSIGLLISVPWLIGRFRRLAATED